MPMAIKAFFESEPSRTIASYGVRDGQIFIEGDPDAFRQEIALEGYLYVEAQEGGYAEDALFFSKEKHSRPVVPDENLAVIVQRLFNIKHEYDRSPKVRVTIEVIE